MALKSPVKRRLLQRRLCQTHIKGCVWKVNSLALCLAEHGWEFVVVWRYPCVHAELLKELLGNLQHFTAL